jgi:hypothetical protein
MPVSTDCYVDFDTYKEEKLKQPEFADGMKTAKAKLQLELELNEQLQQRGITDFFVEVKRMADY